MSMGFLIAASSRKRDDRGRPMDNYTGPEMRRRRDSRGRYMEGEEGNRMAYEDNREAYRPWPDPHIPPYLDSPGMMEDNVRPGSERRSMEDEPYKMRDRNIVNIRDYQDKRRIGFGENRMHHDDRNHDTMENRHHMGDAHHTGAYQMTEPMTMEMAQEWVENMQNTDPEHPTGAKWSMESVKPMAMKHGFTTAEKQLEFWAVMNMMYSDYCETAKKHGVSTMDFYADMAKAWMKDKDAVENKTAAYIEYVTK